MPPEMIRRKAYNQAVDWWALGALIYEMVTGYPPFRHKNRKKLHHKILNDKVRMTTLLFATCYVLSTCFDSHVRSFLSLNGLVQIRTRF